MTKLFVGVDPSITNTGVVVLNSVGALIGYGNTKFSKTPKHPLQEWLRLRTVAEAVLKVIGDALCSVEGSPQVYVAYENYSYDSENKAFTIGELGGVLKLALAEAGVDLCLVEPTRLKKFAVWNGHAGKAALEKEALLECPDLRKVPKKEKTSDLFDAYWLAKWSWYRNDPASAINNETHREFLRRRLELCRKKKEK